jgi:2-oxoisovalerate dehydrogenase E1 component alpha subunit
MDPAPAGLRLRIPQVALVDRPAGRVQFVSAAGEMSKPALNEKVERIALLRKQLVRVLDDAGGAVGPWVPDLTPEQKLTGLRDMLLQRAFDGRMLRAHRQGMISFYMQALGEEAIACAQQRALRPGDMHFPTYRQQGLLIAAGYPLATMMNQILSNELDPLKGRQLPVLYSSKAHGFFSISGNLATQYIQAVGWAMASALRGGTEIASAWIGEGSSAESDFHAALVFASTYQAPVILNLVNNHWAISTPEDFARGASATFADRGYGFSIPALRVDGNDYLAVYAASQWAAERAHTDRVGHPADRRALHLRRPLGLPVRRRGSRVTARRPDRPAQAARDRDRRVGRGAPRRAGRRSGSGGRGDLHAVRRPRIGQERPRR